MIKLCAFADEASEELSGQISALQRNKISLLEIRGVDGENISKLSLKKIEEVKKSLDNSGLRVWSIGSPVGKSDPCVDFECQLDTFKRICEGAQVLGAEKIRMFSFYTKNEADAFRGLEAFLKVAPKDLTLCHENEKGIFGDDYESCLKIHKEFPEIRGVFDPANFVQCGVDTKKAWEALCPYIDYMHIKDALKSGRVVPAGMGDGNLEFLVDSYYKMGGRVLTLEPHLMEFKGLSELENGESVAEIPVYSDNNTAFDAGVCALKKLLNKLDIKYEV